MGKRIHLVYKEYFVGAFLILASLALLALILATLSKNEIFKEYYELRAVFNNKSDIKVAAKVKMSGMKIGRIKDIYFNNDGKVELLLEIEIKYKSMIRSNSVAIIIQERFAISDRIISISSGTKTKEVLEDGMFIKTEDMLNIDVVLNKVVKAFDDITKIIDKINKGEGTLGKVIQEDELYNNLNNISSQSLSLVKKGNYLINSLNSISRKTDVLIDSISPLVEATSSSVKNLPEIFNSVSALLDSANYLIGQINSMTNSMPQMLNKGDNLLGDANQLIGAVKNIWPISNKVKTESEDPPIFIEE